MARKYKSTGCARIFLVLIIVAPIAFFIASYINGSDPIATIKGLFGGEGTTTSIGTQRNEDNSGTADLQEQIDRLEKDVEYYRVESETYKKLLDECQDARRQ